jgi:hypothetical protein
MKNALVSLALLSLTFTAGVQGAALLYDNTTGDTGDTVFYSILPYIALGDQIQLASAGTADQAKVQLFNNGGAGAFDAELDFFDVGSTVGTQLGSFFLTNIATTGGDVLNLTFDLSGFSAPQDLIFVVRANNQNASDINAPLDLGVDMFEPPTPTVGSSDNTFMIAETSPPPIYSQIATNNENVFFQLTGTPIFVAPEVSSMTLLVSGLIVIGLGVGTQRLRGRTIPRH